jgi:hypothetical protein
MAQSDCSSRSSRASGFFLRSRPVGRDLEELPYYRLMEQEDCAMEQSLKIDCASQKAQNSADHRHIGTLEHSPSPLREEKRKNARA